MREFKVGDRVVGVDDSESYKIKNIKGTIIYSNNGIVCVEFDKYVQGHDGSSRNLHGKMGHCVFCGSCIKLLEESSTKKDKKMLKMLKKVINFCPSEKGYGKQYDYEGSRCNGTECIDCWISAIEEKLAEQDKETTELEIVEVKRVAKIGEWVKIVNAHAIPITNGKEDYKNGDILKIKRFDCGRPSYTEREKSGEDHRLKILFKDEYVVLENYKPAEEK